MQIERRGGVTAPITKMWPRVIGGVCEYCGVLDPNAPSTVQYTLCPHFKGMGQLRCSYCPESKDPDDVIYHGNLKVHGSPFNPNEVIVVCDALTCSEKHLARFKVSQ